MRKLFFLLLALNMSVTAAFAHEKNQISRLNKTIVDSFILKINDNIFVNVNRSDNFIKTTNIFKHKNLSFQIEFHFDNEQLFYFSVVNQQDAIKKTFSVKRVKKNGYGYLNIKADYDLDFFFPRIKDENSDALFKQFINNPDFTNNDQIINYAEELYRRIASHIVEETGTINIHGEVVHNQKLNFLYYRFDDEKYSANKKIAISGSTFDKELKTYNNRYQTTFDSKQLNNHQRIYFSNSINDLQNISLQKQNSIDLAELKNLMKIFVLNTDISLQNDLFIDKNFEQIIAAKEPVKADDKKIIGGYNFTNSDNSTKFELRDNYQYYSKSEDKESFGFWKVGERYNSKAIIVYNIYEKNQKIGNISKPVDVGSSFTILISDEKLMYPIGPGMYKEIKKIQ